MSDGKRPPQVSHSHHSRQHRHPKRSHHSSLGRRAKQTRLQEGAVRSKQQWQGSRRQQLMQMGMCEGGRRVRVHLLLKHRC